jgi:hypothetical protein
MLTMEQIKGMTHVPVYFARMMPQAAAVCCLIQGSLIEQSPPEVREMFITYPTVDEIAVVVDYESLKNLTADEAWAAMQHETAHYVLGHIEANLAAGAGNEIVICEDNEFAADAYAAQKVSAAAMRSALEKMAALLGESVEQNDLLAERLRRLA